MIAQLHDWLLLNRPLIFFIYGQVYFVMGIAIVLQSRRYSWLALARRLPWLAAFGLNHAFDEMVYYLKLATNGALIRWSAE
jgi:hypothetical protein